MAENPFKKKSEDRKKEQQEIIDKAKNQKITETVAKNIKATTTRKTAPTKIIKEENKAGRPKGKPSTKISLNVPNEYLELVNIAAGINFKGNTSSYIVELIKKDLEANGKVYEQIKAMKQS